MTDSMNLDSTDIVGSLEDFESLGTIQDELGILNEEAVGSGKEMIGNSEMEIIPDAVTKHEIDIKEEIQMNEKMETEELGDEEMDQGISTDMIDDHLSNEMMENVMKMHDEEIELQHDIDNVIANDNHPLFSEGVIEEIIEGDQVVHEPKYSEEIVQISQDQILEEKTEFIDMINDVTEETVIESGQVEDKTGCEIDPLLINEEPVKEPEPPVMVPNSVFIVNTTPGPISTQPVLQANAMLAAKENPKLARVVAIPTSIDGSIPAGQTIRIVAPQGKILSGMGKTLTLEQAKKMGIISQANLNQILPGNTKTVTVVKSPAKILPAPPNLQHKGQKILIRHGNTLKPGTILHTSAPGSVIRLPSNQITTHLQIPGNAGNKVQYVKLISANKTGTLLPVTLPKTIPVALPSTLLNPSYKVLPLATQQASVTPSTTTQRVLIPASAVTQVTTGAPQTQNINSIVMVPSNLLQMKKAPKAYLQEEVSTGSVFLSESMTPTLGCSLVKEVVPTTVANVLPAQPTNSSLSPNTASSNTNSNVSSLSKDVKTEYWSGEGDDTMVEANGIRPRKPCNCTKSMCLKLYCDCFANGEFCNMCNCTACNNNLDHEEERQQAIKSCLERNPTAFRPKIGKTVTGSEERRHNKGCNCRRSGCLKNYCECYEAKIPCSKNCKCVGCKNTEMFLEKRGPNGEEKIRSKVDSSLIRSQYDQHTANQQRQAFNLMTSEVIQATCQCLIAQAEEWETKNFSSRNVEKSQSLIIEEFGRCVVQIIDCVSKSISQQQLPSSS